jgi:hypothetical protein
VLSITRALVRTVRTHHWSGRHALILALGVLLAVGTIASTPAKAYAVPPAVSTALHAGVDDSGPLAAFGSNVVFGTHRSANTGGTWTSDPTLSTTTWMMAVNGTLVGYRSTGTSVTAVVYTISTGVVTTPTPTLPAVPTSMSGSWILWGSGVAYNAYNFLTSTGPSLMTPPTGTVTDLKPQLTATGAVLWSGTASTLHSVYAVAATPTSAPGAWVTIDAAGGVVVTTSTQLVYVLATTTTVQICGRPLLNLSTAPTCSTVMTGTYDSVYPLFYNFGPWTVVNIWTGLGPAGQYTSFLWNGTLSTSTKIQLPALSSIDQPPAAGMDVYGDTPYVLVRDSNTVPTILRVFQEGTVSAGFSIPPTAASSVGFLAVAPDRVVGADTRDGSLDLPAWTRSVSQSGFGLETLLPLRTSGLAASAARTAVSGPAGLSIYDRGTPRNTITDAHLDQLSGPYITRLGWNTAADSPEIEVATVNNTTVGKFLGTAGTLFGSGYVTWTTDTAPTGSAHVVVNDLTGISPPRTLTLPLGTAVCGAGRVWGDTLFMTCGAKAQAFSLKDGSLLKTYPAPQNQFVNVMDVGDGYAILTFNNFDYNLWDLSLGSLTPLTDCSYDVTSDGAGHVACASSTDLIWRDFSSLSTSAPRLLGALASPTADFSDAVAWTVEFDATKPLKAGTVEISKTGGAVVRTLATAASADGSVRGLSWNGLDGSGKSVPAGSYTYTLKADAVDGTGTVVSSIDGTLPVTGKITVTSPNPAGMNPGAFLSVSTSRLLDTRTTGTPIGSDQTRSLKVTGVGGVPSTGVSAVVLNVTVTQTTGPGYLTVSPTGTSRPLVSNLNWWTGTTIPNAVTVKVGTGGMVDLYQSGPGSAQVIVDVAGYYIGGTVTQPGGFTTLTPARILDTRSTGGKLASDTTRDLQVTGNGGVPASNVSAVVLNVTVTETTYFGYLTVYPTGPNRPTASNLNWTPGLTIPNLVTVKVGDTGKVSLYQSGPGTAQVIADVAGYYLGGTVTQPGMFVALSPVRVLDTRTTTPMGGGGNLTLPILGKGGIPATGVAAVVINTTVTQTTIAGYLTVYPGATSMPLASNLNWSGPGATIPNLVTVQVGNDATIRFYNGSPGSLHVIADTAGYYIAP